MLRLKLKRALMPDATRARTLTVELVHETRACLAALASDHGGLYDGWEAPTA